MQEFPQDIIEQAKALDSKAIATIFEYYYPKIYRYFYYRVRTNEDAEDLVIFDVQVMSKRILRFDIEKFIRYTCIVGQV